MKITQVTNTNAPTTVPAMMGADVVGGGNVGWLRRRFGCKEHEPRKPAGGKNSNVKKNQNNSIDDERTHNYSNKNLDVCVCVDVI